ncbi:tetratricopeptide repeat protein [Paenibacillus sp. KN14-4R]|uniref:tetratricopeptide repeat protein n=1 Tax=Paenibacillus sp. KN14-4R TaxID=3445773 RepID=UPI003FA024AB
MESDFHIKKAYESLLLSDFEAAIDWFHKAIQSDPHNASLYYRLSITYFRSNKLMKAGQYAHQAALLEPDNEVYRLHVERLQAQELVKQAQLGLDGSAESAYTAILLITQALEWDPLLFEGYLLLAEAYVELNDYYPAINAIKEALKLEPEHELAQELLYNYQVQLSQYLGLDRKESDKDE